ncbi:Alpha-N-acetylgalactosamine-specific lectin [Holothuria leucospilota]|uniref:Alpha-N-acetylgalactosamine-specific lectin n=1 Tax=Holothuria leucospilota TaxID=206669 RepID=A0A9Q1HDJ3_HOLLE|nr:Alpha-N-acetylgalactosamine-specific lectin [Holothuria leucospilota]
MITPSKHTDGQCKCLRPFVYFESNCYYFANVPRYFDEAEEICKEFSYHTTPGPYLLASVQTAEENTFIYERARQHWSTKDYWFGAKDDNLDGNFHWLDGSAMNFTSFALGEPTFNRHCLQQWATKGWDDVSCSEREKHFVCKKSAMISSCM